MAASVIFILGFIVIVLACGGWGGFIARIPGVGLLVDGLIALIDWLVNLIGNARDKRK